MTKVVRIKYFTKDKLALINENNWKKYEKYLKSNIIKNREVEKSTYNTYENYMKHFLVFLAEEYGDMDLYSEEFMEEAVDIMENYISFLQTTLQNNKKVINTKISTVSSFYHWSVKRKLVKFHPFDKRLDRMKGSGDEKIKNSYFLTEDQINLIKEGLKDEKKFDIQDRVLFNLAIDSANRIGALQSLTLSKMDLDEGMFTDVREKRGKRVEVCFEEETKELIEQWLYDRGTKFDLMKVDALFIAKRNGEYNPMSKGNLQRRIKAMGTIIGLDDFYAHATRKSAINLIVEKTGDIALGAEIANHNSIETTRASYVKPRTKAETRNKIKEMIKEKENAKLKETVNES